MRECIQRYPASSPSWFFNVHDRSGVFRRDNSPFWMIEFRHDGRRIRESSGCFSKRLAIAYRKQRMLELGIGIDVALRDVPTLEEAGQALLDHIVASGKSGYAPVAAHLRNLREGLGADTRIAEIAPHRMEHYVRCRRASGLKESSVYNEMSTLRRCLRLQWKRHRLLVLPEFPMPAQGRPRQGFFTAEEVDRLCLHLPAHAVNAVRFAWETGWRRSEVFGLRWREVDWHQGLIFLRDSKNGEPRQLPFEASESLSQILREQRASAAGLELARSIQVDYVFHYAGRPLPEGLRRCWASACRKAGLQGRLFHDLRRSFIQRCEDANVPRSSAMKITGHKTEAVYARYAIAPRSSLESALRTLENVEHEVQRLPLFKRRKHKNMEG